MRELGALSREAKGGLGEGSEKRWLTVLSGKNAHTGSPIKYTRSSFPVDGVDVPRTTGAGPGQERQSRVRNLKSSDPTTIIYNVKRFVQGL